MNETARFALSLTKKIHQDIPNQLPPDEGSHSHNQLVFSQSLVKHTRGYIEKVVNQINGTYEQGWYDACAVMIRRVIETLIIEAFSNIIRLMIK
ncbi:hypothetical protein [Paenibacillus protaetiae]|uniref:hypothetical protein n=1 Tax=Paenibacillus protaetiae TaxID=2509456 RepID=UPI001ABE8149|nr:hypothetical protein [Paenibacillus protaetiae]